MSTMEFSQRIRLLEGSDEFLAACDAAIDALRTANRTLADDDKRDVPFTVALLFCEVLRPLIGEISEPHHDLEASLRTLLGKAADQRLMVL